ncbi:MAG TPA: IclR family transcriptional regulator [Comamonas sp.]|uniref:IclR family transcriptional regulator n=1 Tax=Comamonas halotolerans TaxID=3041496 RepID=UPI0024E13DF9|nr:IclR family transcriptional regulator [Comamonas sp. NoAH]
MPATFVSAPTPQPLDRNYVIALARGLDVLSCFRSGEKLLGNQDIAKRCKLPKSTVSRLTYTLTTLGYLIHVPEEGKYRLGTATLALGSAMLSGMDVRKLARPLMHRLAELTQCEVALATRDRHNMVYVEHCPSPQPMDSDLDIGTRLPLGTTAIGRAWLAACPLPERQQALDYLQAHAPDQWADAVQQQTQWPQHHDRAHPWLTTSFGDWLPHVNAIALAFSPGRGLPLMAISCGGPARLISADMLMQRAKPELERMVRRLQQAIYQA